MINFHNYRQKERKKEGGIEGEKERENLSKNSFYNCIISKKLRILWIHFHKHGKHVLLSLASKFYIRRHKNEVDPTERGSTAIVRLFPWSDEENCSTPRFPNNWW